VVGALVLPDYYFLPALFHNLKETKSKKARLPSIAGRIVNLPPDKNKTFFQEKFKDYEVSQFYYKIPAIIRSYFSGAWHCGKY